MQDQHEQWGDASEQIGLPKTGVVREVSMPPVLVVLVRAYVGDRTSGPLVVTRDGNVPTYSNWTRAWNRARRKVGGRWTLYMLRHAHAAHILDRGLPLGTVAYRMGHSVDTLIRTYVGRSAGDEARANELADGIEAWNPDALGLADGSHDSAA